MYIMANSGKKETIILKEIKWSGLPRCELIIIHITLNFRMNQIQDIKKNPNKKIKRKKNLMCKAGQFIEMEKCKGGKVELPELGRPKRRCPSKGKFFKI
jgi:hypothetical protein